MDDRDGGNGGGDWWHGGNNGGGDAFGDVLLVNFFFLNVLHGLRAFHVTHGFLYLCVLHDLFNFPIAFNIPNFHTPLGFHVTSSA